MNSEREELDRIHGPEVTRLATAGDWAGLCRYWLAHQYPPALDRGIEVVEGRSPNRAELARYLRAVRKDPLDRDRAQPGLDRSQCSCAGKRYPRHSYPHPVRRSMRVRHRAYSGSAKRGAAGGS